MPKREQTGMVKAWVPESWPCGDRLLDDHRCQGRMRPARVDYNYDGVMVYEMPCRKCDGCGRLSLSERSFRAMDIAAKKTKPAKKPTKKKGRK